MVLRAAFIAAIVAAMKWATSARAVRARAVAEELKTRFCTGLRRVSEDLGHAAPFEEVGWGRGGGRHGGGSRAQTGGTPVFQRATVNVSQVHYEDLPDRRLASATALSTIVHPAHPRAPSVHAHVSHTESRDGSGYWRMMADLNPSVPDPASTEAFAAALAAAAKDLYFDAAAQGDRYFFIPALGRHRGVTHFYLEGHDSGDFGRDEALAHSVGAAAIDAYLEILETTLAGASPPTEAEIEAQLGYHTLYLFQVLTLDRGTTSGLLVHDENDVGILGSLPARVDRSLLASWRSKMSAPQDLLLDRLVAALPEQHPAPVEAEQKRAFAAAIRAHYQAHPEALSLQAAGDLTPPTVANHRSI